MTDFSTRKSRKTDLGEERGIKAPPKHSRRCLPGAGDAENAWGEGIFPWELLLPWAAGEKTMGYITGALAGRKEFSSLFHKTLHPTGQGDPQGPHSRAVPSTAAENSTENQGFSMDFQWIFHVFPPPFEERHREGPSG